MGDGGTCAYVYGNLKLVPNFASDVYSLFKVTRFVSFKALDKWYVVTVTIMLPGMPL